MNNFTLLFTLFSAFTQISQAAQKPDLMLTVGDSISAGFLSYTNAENDQRKSNGKPPPFTVHDLEMKYRIGQLANDKSLSWSSGDKVNSHFMRLKAYLAKNEPDAKLEVENFALTGAKAINLDLESKKILETWNTGKYRSIKYMTFLMGNNDVCSLDYAGGTPDLLFSQQIRTFFRQISVIEQNEPIRVLVSGLPRIADVAFPENFDHVVIPGVSCRDMELKYIQYCNPILNWTTPAEYADRTEKVLRRNRVMKQTFERLAWEYPKKFQFSFTDVLSSPSITIKTNGLAGDCFHPNILGQETFSEVLWNAQPWFK